MYVLQVLVINAGELLLKREIGQKIAVISKLP
jgi:hypothetical protein